MPLLTKKQIREALQELPNWRARGKALYREHKAKSFKGALRLLNQIAELAEREEHHPDICIKDYNRLIISLTTHDEGGITDLDVEMAKKIEELLPSR